MQSVREANLTASDHRRRMLAHQEKIAAERRLEAVKPIDPQLRIPLVGEVRKTDPGSARAGGRRTKKTVQLTIKGV
jgi:hypothetical protein